MEIINLLVLLIFIIVIELLFNNSVKKKSFNNNHFLLDESGKLKINNKCNYSGVGFDENHEVGECSVAIQIIPLCNNVLEIGGGAGKVSHMINSILAERNLETQHIVVEPGSIGYGNHGDENIYLNKEKFKDKYTVVKKLCGDLTMEDIKIFDKPPDCLFVDCEGCLKDCQETAFFKYVLENVRFIVNEMDGFVQSPTCDQIIKNKWKSFGFKKIATGYGCGVTCDTEIWYKE